jgi:hypothetical protein
MLDNPKVDALATELAAITGESTTDAVITALEQRLSRERFRSRIKRINAEEILEFADQFADESDPVVTSDHSWMYDEFGLPK